ncbi:hypothetical protein ACWKT5_01490 [Streptomyces avermitilis]
MSRRPHPGQAPADRAVELDLAGLRQLDHARTSALQNWADQYKARIVQPERSRARA